jgi:hypothetical protein
VIQPAESHLSCAVGFEESQVKSLSLQLSAGQTNHRISFPLSRIKFYNDKHPATAPGEPDLKKVWMYAGKSRSSGVAGQHIYTMVCLLP